MYCSKCGSFNVDENCFCVKCGEPLQKTGPEEKISAAGKHERWMFWNRKHDLIAMTGSMLLAVSVFLPFFSVTFFGTKRTVTYIEGDGKFMLALALASAVAVFSRFRFLYAFFVVASTFFTVFAVTRFGPMETELFGSTYDLSSLVTKEAGYYIMIIGSVISVIGMVLRFKYVGTDYKDVPVPEKEINLDSLREKIEPLKVRVKKSRPQILGVIGVMILIIMVTKAAGFIANKYFLNKEERQAVNEVISAIEEIGEITIDSEASIKRAESLYDSLGYKEQKHVTNSQLLEMARVQYDEICSRRVSDEIALIGEIEWKNYREIERVVNEYDELSDHQKELVQNKDILETASEYIKDISKIESVVDEMMNGIDDKFDEYGLAEEDIRDGIIEGICEDLSYSDLNYLTQEKFDELSNKLMKYVFSGYSIEEIQISGDKAKADVKVESRIEGISNGLGEIMATDTRRYIENNKSWLSLSYAVMTEKAFYAFLLDYLMSEYSSKWIANIEDLAKTSKSETASIEVECIRSDDDWEIAD